MPTSIFIPSFCLTLGDPGEMAPNGRGPMIFYAPNANFPQFACDLFLNIF